MPITSFDHVNLRTTRLKPMIDWYEKILGLKAGWRPDFPFDGAWLYLGDRAIVHISEVSGHPSADGDLTLEHFALRATDLDAFKSVLDQNGIDARLAEIADASIVQVNIHDPDGNHIHVDFDTNELNS